MPYASETSKHRAIFWEWIQGNGVDVGFGGDPVRPSAITIDVDPHADCGSHPINLVGDATLLHWFGNGVLSYVFSSHCLEDFVDTEGVLREWLRVLMPGGYLCLLLPDQKKYVAHCKRMGTVPNGAHKHANFGLPYIKAILDRIGGTEVTFENDHLDEYNIAIVARKF